MAKSATGSEHSPVAVVTGGAAGIGKASVKAFLAKGYDVAAIDVSEEGLDQLRKACEAGDRLLTLTADLSSAKTTQAAFEKIGHWRGRIDAVFANAGINGVWAPLSDLKPEEWDQTLAVNLTGTFLTIKFALPWLERARGSVVITSSVNGTRMFSNSGATAYAVSKAGQVALAKMLALELAPKHVRINVICPGAISTSIEDSTERRQLEETGVPVEFPKGEIPLTAGAPGRAKDVAELVLFLSSEQARHITGTEVWIDGAQSLLRG